MKKLLNVPFRGKHMLRHGTRRFSTDFSEELVPGTTFTDNLVFDRYASSDRGRNPYVILYGMDTKKHYTMSIHHFMKIAPRMEGGNYRSTFGFTHSGGVAYSIYEVSGDSQSWKVPFESHKGMVRSEPFQFTSIFGRKDSSNASHDVLWLDPRERFRLSLTFRKMHRSKTSSYVELLSTGGHKYYMFMSDFEAALPKMFNGRLEGTFKFKKIGRHYGIQLV